MLCWRRWHSATVTYDGLELRLYVNYKLCASTPSGTQFSDEVTPVHVGCDVSRDTFTNHFEGFISEACIWNRALPHAEVQALSAESPLRGGTLERGLLGAWRFLESGDLALQEAGRVIIPNDAFSPRGRPPRSLSWPASNGTSLGAWPHGPSSDDVATPPRDPSDGMDGIGPAQAMHGVLKTLSHMHPIGLTLRPGVQAVLVELGAVGHDLSRHWVQALSRIGVQAMRSGTRAAGGAQASRSNDRKAGPQSQLANGAATTSAVVAAAEAANAVASGILAPAADDLERRYCYMGMSVALQKNLTQVRAELPAFPPRSERGTRSSPRTPKAPGLPPFALTTLCPPRPTASPALSARRRGGCLCRRPSTSTRTKCSYTASPPATTPPPTTLP